jgi:hypothetical protein
MDRNSFEYKLWSGFTLALILSFLIMAAFTAWSFPSRPGDPFSAWSVVLIVGLIIVPFASFLQYLRLRDTYRKRTGGESPVEQFGVFTSRLIKLIWRLRGKR